MKELCLPTMACYGQPMAKADLRTLAVRLPEDARIPMLLGLDGDCDFPAA